MGGTVAAAGAVGAAAALAVGLVIVGGAYVATQRLSGAADAAALAAADAASGAVFTTEAPCELAARVAAANGATLSYCELDGQIATVGVTAAYSGISTLEYARAGPPEASR